MQRSLHILKVEVFAKNQIAQTSSLEDDIEVNRYTSHELRTAIMVMQGAITLLAQSDDPIFIERQRKRLQKACFEISDFIETLLSLTQKLNPDECLPRHIDTAYLADILQAHQHLALEKPISLDIEIKTVFNKYARNGVQNFIR